jgi:phosphoenolpyruvate carboxylase
MRESIGAALREFKARNVPVETVQMLLDKLSIELVFTAHPTESKRRTMLNKLQRLSHRLQNPGALIEDEITGIENPRALEREMTALWLTDRSRTTRPEVTDEVRTGLWYFDTTLWQTVPLLQDELERALSDGQGPEALDHFRLLDGRRPRRQSECDPDRHSASDDAPPPARSRQASAISSLAIAANFRFLPSR